MVIKSGDVSSNSSRWFFNNKSAQVTVFIIIGIIILFVFAGIMFFTKTITKQEILVAEEPVVADVPSAFKPIQLYTESCILEIGKKGLLILGEQGGYIYPDSVGKFSVSEPTDADGIDLEPLKIPYWHYNALSNSEKKVVYTSLKPELYLKDDPAMSIEAQLSRFVEERLDTCLDDYNVFNRQGFEVQVINSDAKAVDVKVGEASVNFLLEMKVNSFKGTSENLMEMFYVSIPLNLKSYYEVADKINTAQQDNFYLEKQGMELITVYSKVDPEYLPPVSDVGYELFAPFSWNENNVKESFKGLLTSYVPMLRYLGSNNFYYHVYPEGNLLAQKFVDNMVLPLLGAESLSVNFDYFGWEPYFKTNSDSEGTIRPEHIFIKFNVLSFSQQRYETHYDASYPVMVSIKDEYAFSGEGYNFVFAMESNIRNNKPAISGQEKISYPKTNDPIACDENQKNTELIKTVVVDSFSKEPIELVKIGFSIPELTDCEIGMTDSSGVVESKYPAAYGGVINFINPEYLIGFYPINTYEYKDTPLVVGYSTAGAEGKVIELHKLKEIDISVKKKDFKKCVTPLICEELDILIYEETTCEKGSRTCFFDTGLDAFLGEPAIEMEANGSLGKYLEYHFINKEKGLTKNEEAIIIMERVAGFNDEIIEDDFVVTINLAGNDTQNVNLVPGIYKVSGYVTLNNEVLIPKEERCSRYDVLLWESEKCFDIDEVIMDQYVTGNLEWNTKETYLTITPDDLYTSKELTFYLPSQDILSVPLQLKGKKNVVTVESGVEAASAYVTVIYGSVSTIENVVDYFGDGGEFAIPSRIVEDMQVPGRISEIANDPGLRAALNPKFS
jgi:hypothetical protein